VKTIVELYGEAAAGNVQIHGGLAAATAAGIFEQSGRLAAGLSDLGLGHGDRIAAWLPNLAEYLCLHAACARLGVILVAINTRFGAAEIADITDRSGAKALTVAGGGNVLAEIDPRTLPELTHLITIGETADLPAWDRVAVTPYGQLVGAATSDIRRGGGNDLVNIFTTSGTTSAPKFAAHRQDAIVGHAEDVARFLDMTAPDSCCLQLLPFCGVFGFVQIMAALAAPADLIMPVSFDANQAMTLGRRHGATHMFITDDMLRRMLDASADETPLPTLRSCMYAGFNTWLHTLPAEAEARGIPVQGAFGMSEVFAIFAGRPMAAAAAARHRPGGTMVSDASQVRARDPESGALMGHGEAGELEIFGPHMFAEYYGNSEATTAAFTDDGYLKTGDLGYTEPDHAFVYLQRMNDTLRLGGFLVAPSEIEAAVMDHPAVRDAQVVAAGTDAGNRPVAFVIPASETGVNEDVVIRHCRDQLPKFKAPVRVVSLDAFPVTRGPNGTKIQRTKLREMAEDLLRG